LCITFVSNANVLELRTKQVHITGLQTTEVVEVVKPVYLRISQKRNTRRVEAAQRAFYAAYWVSQA